MPNKMVVIESAHMMFQILKGRPRSEEKRGECQESPWSPGTAWCANHHAGASIIHHTKLEKISNSVPQSLGKISVAHAVDYMRLVAKIQGSTEYKLFYHWRHFFVVSVILASLVSQWLKKKKKKKKDLLQCRRQFQSLSLEDSLKKEMVTHSSVLAWNKEKQQRRPRKMDTEERLNPRQKLNRNPFQEKEKKKGWTLLGQWR